MNGKGCALPRHTRRSIHVVAADTALYALDDPRYFGLHDVAVGPVASGGRPALKGLWVSGERVVADDALKGWM